MRRSPLAFVLPALVHLLAVPRGLSADWIRYDTERATALFEEGVLSSDEMARFSRLVDAGIGHIESYLRTAAGPEGLRTGRIIYRVGDTVPYSTTRGRTVHLPLERVRSDSAPYLHETVHVLVPCPHRSVWLAEGFASYVESHVSATFGGYDAHVFSRTGNRGVDGEAARWLAREGGRAVLPYIGAPGQPPEMLRERRRVAAPFYVMSQSFTKFLVERLGLERVLGSVMSREPEQALERSSGQPVEAWKAEWLASIGAGA
jgi:hypothetical protein